eukprot:TRINITY_DN223_c0_g2_i2.p2 TRINITY_DN223_c0_g2~~TRINITY_DN223_c0_g2_i2.p2  ORF type:complete len:127 (-),score=7.13 TRINITY_DN223_c0_g2_i2:94-474(-)
MRDVKKTSQTYVTVKNGANGQDNLAVVVGCSNNNLKTQNVNNHIADPNNYDKDGSVSIVPPAYYGHHICTRGRVYEDMQCTTIACQMENKMFYFKNHKLQIEPPQKKPIARRLQSYRVCGCRIVGH